MYAIAAAVSCTLNVPPSKQAAHCRMNCGIVKIAETWHFLYFVHIPKSSLTICIFIKPSPSFASNRNSPGTDGFFRSL